MLLTDPFTGELVPPGHRSQEFGGDFNSLGIPAGFSIPTTGDYTGVVVSDVGIYTGKNLKRTTLGYARAQGPLFKREDEPGLTSYRVRMSVRGGTTIGAPGTQTARSFRWGMISDDRQNGAYLEALPPDVAYDPDYEGGTYGKISTYFVGLSGGVQTRKKVPTHLGPDHNREFSMDLWIVRMIRQTGQSRWQMAVGDWDASVKTNFFLDTEVGAGAAVSLRPFIEWQFLDASGNFDADLHHLSLTTYRRW